MKKIYVSILLSLFFINNSNAQSSNCSTATNLSLSSGSVCVNGTNMGATTDNTLYGTCNTAPINMVWYTYIANGSNNTFTVTPDTLTNAEIVVYTVACPDSFGQMQTCKTKTGDTTLITTWGMTVGEHVWIGVASNQGTNGSFQFCINSTPTGTLTGNTCAEALTVCGNYNVASMAANASGQLPTCFGAAPQQDMFIQFTISQAGTLAWTAMPNITTTEFDWCLWNITASCPGTVTCCNYNYAGGSSDGFGMQAQTGTVACGYSSVTDAPLKEFCAPISVTAGQVYAIQISNYESDNSGFSLSFTNSTCQLSCNTTNISKVSKADLINMYPNPNNGSFVIEPNSTTKQTMQVYDITGKLVLTQTINGKTIIDASSLNEGVYNISLQSAEGVLNKRLVIVR
jgi:hypothetical protein